MDGVDDGCLPNLLGVPQREFSAQEYTQELQLRTYAEQSWPPGSDMTGNVTKINGHVAIKVRRGERLSPRDQSSKSDPYVQVLVDRHELGRTKVVSNSTDPVWNYEHWCYLHGYLKAETCFSLLCWNRDRLKKDSLIGSVCVPVEDLLNRSVVHGLHMLEPVDGSSGGIPGLLDLELAYVKDERDERRGECPKYNITNVQHRLRDFDSSLDAAGSSRSGTAAGTTSFSAQSPSTSPRSTVLDSPRPLGLLMSPRFRLKKKETSLA